MVIIQACLANRDHAPAFGEFAQRHHHVLLGLFGIGRMNANHRVDIRILLGKIDSALATLD